MSKYNQQQRQQRKKKRRKQKVAQKLAERRKWLAETRRKKELEEAQAEEIVRAARELSDLIPPEEVQVSFPANNALSSNSVRQESEKS